MSADLELRLPIIKLRPISRDSDKINIDADSERSCISEEEEDCRTPKSPEHMIPPILCCPPAPRKPRRRTSCKRKLCELDFFEVVAKEDIDSFFRTAEENIAAAATAAKRRCVL